MLQPLVRRTWAPRGHTPILRSWDRHDRLSVISVLTVSPKRKRIGLYFAVHHDNIHAVDAKNFMRALRRQLGGRKILLVWDRLNVHRTAAKQLQGRGIAIEWLPPYAPDLNPVEQVWNHTKYAELSNLVPENIDDLASEIVLSLSTTRYRQSLLHSFFDHAGLFL